MDAQSEIPQSRDKPGRDTERDAERDSERVATVLVVDDDEGVRETTAAILGLAGFHVLLAKDGTSATWMLASEHVDVLLLDLHLGRLDGTSVLDTLEESSTVVIFSAFGYFEEADIRRELGPVVFECLRKPVPPERLVEVITAAADRGRDEGHELRVRPISPRNALRLAMAGLSRMTPETENEDPAMVTDISRAPQP
jgi:DNA-binding NtrC family response regulator